MKQFLYRIKRIYHWGKTGILGGFLSQCRYGQPQKKLKIIAVTGTDGKTTTATLIYQLLKDTNKRVALISTVAAYIGDQALDTGFHVTSPDPRQLYRLLAQMVKQKVEYLVLEITSQGAYQYRNWGLKPILAGLTNVAHDHYDYHLNFDNYLAAKTLVLKSSALSVVNEDVPYFNQLKRLLKKKTKLVTFSRASRFSAPLESYLRAKFKEDYNRLNAYLALTMVKQLGLQDKDLIAGIENFKLPPGRMEVIPTSLEATVIVDFAHTPQGLEAALKGLRKNYLQQGKTLVAVFGCAGERDPAKRPIMGKIGADLADVVIFTAEDPRRENIWTIINQMKTDLAPNHGKVISIPNREAAVKYALEKFAHSGNTIGIFGKGHEQSLNYDGLHETPWSDITAAKRILRRLEATKKT